MITFFKHYAFLLLFFLLFLGACSVSKKVQQTDILSLPELSSEQLLEKLQSNEVEVEWLHAKAKINFQDEKQTKNFTATIRLRKDSVLWMNVKKLSVEAARILIDKDSVYVIDRLHKQYYIKSLSYLADNYHLPADFEAIQTLLLGNPYLFDNTAFQVKNHPTNYQLSSEDRDGKLSDYWINGQSFLLEAMSFLDLRYERKLLSKLEDYQTSADSSFRFAHQRVFEMESEKTGTVKVRFKFVEVEPNVPKRMPFSISSRYKRVE